MRLPRDHPRSRGVYYKEVVDGQPVIGSSPLARGLHFLSPSIRPQAGIIPARAGFTVGRRRARLWAGDHPRSRGVYALNRLIFLSSAGSSPLARGLRQAGCLRGPRTRIIPARAGFTEARRHSRYVTRDHPRSRGVYSTAISATVNCLGSSPLARGLRERKESLRPGAGIIPARAGFTFRFSARIGVSPGSSPLARGLHAHGPLGGSAYGIIPARAGFTPSSAETVEGAWDHPRSRGVYVDKFLIPMIEKGSSPLARGLLRPRRACRRVASDHPRSRGVYLPPTSLPVSSAGSSPLARGLQSCTQCTNRTAGIIPARAGFTRVRVR